MKIAFIHNEKKIGTGANYINDLMANKLKARGIEVKNFYPNTELMDSPVHLKGLANILFFYGLLEHRKSVARYSIIQGTTYTPLPFLALPIPVVTHFGSTTAGFLKSVPLANKLEASTRSVWYALRREGVIGELNLRTRRPLRDIAEIEHYAADKATAVIATSKKVRAELMGAGVNGKKIKVIHNAIEDYWFKTAPPAAYAAPSIVFLGRLGQDVFTYKLKGLDRLIHLHKKFPSVPKLTVCMTFNKDLKKWLKTAIPRHTVYTNLRKDLIPNVLRPMAGSILFVPSRYEGFSLSLIEGMSQGLIPVTYSVGVAPEIIKNGRNGFIVKNQREAIQRVRQILDNEYLRLYMSAQAYRTAEQFKSDYMAERLHMFYRTLVRNAAAERRAKSNSSRARGS
jgi:glycosyltransferase involved in cell wall biosynthesis